MLFTSTFSSVVLRSYTLQRYFSRMLPKERQQKTNSPGDSYTKRARQSVTAHTTTTTALPMHPNVLMWFRSDLRVRDNPALYMASNLAFYRRPSHLLALYIISPEDHTLHDDAPIKIDFRLRNTASLRARLAELHIPLVIETVNLRAQIPETILAFCNRHNVSDVFFNVEYEVDEGRRDAKVSSLLQANGLRVQVSHDQCVVKPGDILATSTGRPYVSYVPFKNAWIRHVESQTSPLGLTLLHLAPEPSPNNPAILTDPTLKPLFTIPHPTEIPNFELSPELSTFARTTYESGESAAHAQLTTFVTSRAATYHTMRDIPSHQGGTSRLSPYLAAGVISAKQCVRAAWEANDRQLESGKQGFVMWIQEVVWREFYRHVLWAFPHVSMAKPFKEEAARIEWVRPEDGERYFFRAWCEGRTGYPIVDAGMWCVY